MALTTYPTDSHFYWICNHDGLHRLFIMADHPKAKETATESPSVPVVNKVALDLILELTSSKATAEGKLELLKRAIEHL